MTQPRENVTAEKCGWCICVTQHVDTLLRSILLRGGEMRTALLTDYHL